MYINRTSRFDIKGGVYCVLGDYSTEGMQLVSQHKTLPEAVASLGDPNMIPCVIVKLIDIVVQEA